MSLLASTRLPYADAETPSQMRADCRAAGAHLRIPSARTAPLPDTSVERPEHRPTQWQVSAHAAQLASGLHLHLD